MCLKITNSYFQNGACSDFDLLAFQMTSRLMKNYQILIKKDKNAFSFYAGLLDKTDVFSAQNNFSGIEDLYFQVINTNSLFFNYTDISPVNDQKLYYFENSSAQDNTQQLQKSQFVSDKDIVSYKAKTFNISIPDKKVILEIKSNNGQTIKSETIDGDIIKNYFINLNQFDDGIYELWLNNELQEKFFMTNEEIMEDCIGIVKLNMNNIISQNQDNLKFSIDFNARSVFWQYKIVVKKTRKIQIIDMDILGKNYEFYDGPVEEEIIGNQIAQVFTSTVPIQMHNQIEKNPLLLLTYSNDFSNRNNQLEKKLPGANPEQVKQYNHGEDGISFFSSTIIYV